MANSTKRATHNGGVCLPPHTRIGADNRPASSPRVGNANAHAAYNASFSQEWPCEPTCPTVELPVCDKVAPVAKSATKWDAVAWQEIGVALWAILLLVVVASIGGGR